MYITDSLTGADPGFFFRRRCTRLLLYFNNNKPHSVFLFFFFFCRIPVVLENRRSSQGGGVCTPCTLPLDPPLSKLHVNLRKYDTLIFVSVHGGLGQWGDWSGCDKTCGLGKRTRERPCDNPKPQYGGRPCNDSGRREFRYCREQRCPIGLLCFKTLFR